MAILDTDTTNGWIRETCPPVVVCPGTAGYALDSSDMLHLGRIAVQNNGTYYTPNHATGDMLNFGYYTTNYLAGYKTGGAFSKGYLSASVFNGGTSQIQVTGLSGGHNWTMRGWIEITNSDQRQLAYFDVTNILTTGTYKSLNVGFYYGQLKLLSHNGAFTGVEVFSASTGSGFGFKYITMTKQGNVLSFYSNGVFIGSYTLPTLTSSAITIKPVLGVTSSYQTANFMDINVSYVVRNGLFVPTGILGF